MRRNILIAYLLAFCKNTWFWLGIWIFYYLKFTNYAGIGLVETVMITTTTFAEIPTGAIADLFGKKNTLVIAFALEAVGAVLMATTTNFPMLAFSVFVMCVGGAFYSGTLDALLFDTLKEHQQEKIYDKKISTVNTIALIAPAVCGLLGGFMYVINPRFPFFASAATYSLGFVGALFLIEPKIDTEKFSFANFWLQTRKGLHELFKTADIRQQTILLLSVGFIVVITSEMLNSFLGFEFGFTAAEQGILWSAIFLISALASQTTPYIRQKFKNYSMILVAVVIALSLVISPAVGLIVGGISLTLRTAFEGIFGNLTSIMVNNNTESKYRATTISTFNMIKNLPYVLTAFFIGSLADRFSAKYVAVFLGVVLFFFVLMQLRTIRKARMV